MKAMILAAGEGTRLRPLTFDVPKALLPVRGLPLIEHTVLWLKAYGINDIAINLHHRGEKIVDFLGDGSRLGVSVVYSAEEKLLGTAGGVKRMEHFFGNTFVVVYGDTFTNFPLSDMVDLHCRKQSSATLALFSAPNPWEVGIANVNQEGRLIDLVEKPPRGQEPGHLANGGIYVLEKEILKFVPAQGSCDFAYDVFPKIIKLGLPVYGYRVAPEYYLVDIGTPEKYRRVNDEMGAKHE